MAVKTDKSKAGALRGRTRAKKNEREGSTAGRNPAARGGLWRSPESKRVLLLAAITVIISVLLFPNVLTRPRLYKLGDVADRDIKASQEFLLEDTELTERNRQEAARAVSAVYDLDPTAANLIPRIGQAFSGGRQFLTQYLSVSVVPPTAALKTPDAPVASRMTAEEFKTHLFDLLDISPNEALFEALLADGFSQDLETALVTLVAPIIKEGVVSNKNMLQGQSVRGIILHDIQTQRETRATDPDRFFDLIAARNVVKGQSDIFERPGVSPKERKLFDALAQNLIKPNLTFNKRETEVRKELAQQAVKPFYIKIKQGEMLVREGERITADHLARLSEEYKFSTQTENFGRMPAMTLLIGFLLASVYTAGLLTRRASRNEMRDLLFLAIGLLITCTGITVFKLIADEIARGFHFLSSNALLYAIPFAAGPMLVAIALGKTPALGFGLVGAVLGALLLGGQIDFLMYFFVGALIAVHGIENCRQHGTFVRSGLKVGLANAVLALAIEALSGSLYSLNSLVVGLTAFSGGILAGVIAAGVLPLAEITFGYTSDIKLLELANLDQPLLRELMVQAPGTYHHSVIVSHMVEAAAPAVGANPLLAKVAAYYHDIGKITKPLYFIENQMDCENKHEKLAPSLSSLILIAHVKDGVELARQHKLGQTIVDIIQQSHGTNLISYFYEKAREHAERRGEKFAPVNEEGFRYPGPKPQTKEAGLVMLADVVEAASRTLVDPTAARTKGMVQKIINKLFSDGQLDECELTLKELHEIAKSFIKTLSAIFHHRVEYPEPVAKNGTARLLDFPRNGQAGEALRRGGHADSDQLPAQDSGPKKGDDAPKNRESLRRLGLQ